MQVFNNSKFPVNGRADDLLCPFHTGKLHYQKRDKDHKGNDPIPEMIAGFIFKHRRKYLVMNIFDFHNFSKNLTRKKRLFPPTDAFNE